MMVWLIPEYIKIYCNNDGEVVSEISDPIVKHIVEDDNIAVRYEDKPDHPHISIYIDDVTRRARLCSISVYVDLNSNSAENVKLASAVDLLRFCLTRSVISISQGANNMYQYAVASVVDDVIDHVNNPHDKIPVQWIDYKGKRKELYEK